MPGSPRARALVFRTTEYEFKPWVCGVRPGTTKRVHFATAQLDMGDKNSLKLVLQDGRGRSRTYTFTMKSPKNPKTLKAFIQRKLSIPTFCQEVYYESMKLNDETDLEAYRIKEGDTFRICYDTPADISPVLRALKSLKELVKFLEDDEQQDQEMEILIKDISNVARLWEKYFDDNESGNFYTNMQFFIKRGGVELALRAHTALLVQPGCRGDSPLQTLELGLLLMWARLCHMLDTATMKHIVQLVLDSFRRQESGISMGMFTDLWKETMWAAIKALYK